MHGEGIMKENRAILWISIAFLFLLLVPILRFTNTLPPGDIPYHHLRIAERYLTKGPFSLDEIYHFPVPFTPFHLLLAGFIMVFSSSAAFILPLILFGSSSALFYAILKEMGVSIKLRFFTLLMLIASPISVFASSSLVQEGFSVFLLAAGIFIFLRSEWWSLPFFVLAIWQSIFSLFILIILFTFYWHEKGYFPKGIMVVLLIFALFVHSWRFDPFPETVLSSIVTDLGADVGIGIFVVVLLFLGLYHLWAEKYVHLGKYILFILSVSAWFFFGSSAAFYANFVFAYFTAQGILSLQNTSWESPLIKRLTLLVLICGILFSFLSYANRLSHALPDVSIQEGALWLAQYTQPESIILSAPSRGFWLEYFGKRHALATPLHSVDVNSIFYSRNMARTRDLLQTYQIKYIWLDKEVKHSIWTKEDEGLQFLFNNKEMFRKVYDEKGVEIWKVS